MTPDSPEVWAHRLEATSKVCATAFRTVLPQVARILETAAFDHWARQGLTLAQSTWRGSECAAWYFSLSPQFLARLDLDALIRLIEPTLRAMEVSPQLGIDVLRAAARFIEHDQHMSVHDWVTMGARLTAVGRYGQVAAAYFEVSPEVLALIGRNAFLIWTGVLETLASTTEVLALEFSRQSPRRLENIPVTVRPQALRLAEAMASHAPTTILAVWQTLPDALHTVASGLRARLLDLSLHIGEAAPRQLERLLRVITRWLQGLSEMEQELLLGQCLRVALVDAEAATHLCEHLPGVLSRLAANDVEAWVTRGLVILRDNHDGGLAYFAQESQASQDELAALGRTAYLSSIQGVLRLYACALAGRSLGVRPLADLPPVFRSTRRQFPTTDGETIYLPECAGRFTSHEENFRMFLVMTAHQAGYLEFATFQFELETLVACLGTTGRVPELQAWREPSSQLASSRSDFERFFAGFTHSTVARDIFYCLEDGRVDYLLCQLYPGLAPHIQRIIRDGLSSRPPLAGCPLWVAVLEVLLHVCGAGTLLLPLPPLLVPLARFLGGVVCRVRQPQATVYDSAMATIEVYLLLEQLPNVRVGALDDASVDGEVVTLDQVWSKDVALEAFRELMPVIPAGEEVSYQSPDPLPHQGDLKPDLVQRKLKVKELSDKLEQSAKAAAPISPELLRELFEQGVDIDIHGTISQEQDTTSGVFVSDLEDKGLSERVPRRSSQPDADPERIREQLNAELKQLGSGEVVFRYDEWDYVMHDYRAQWCMLREKSVEGEALGFVAGILQQDGALIAEIRRQFQLLKPEMFKKLKRRDHGEDIDIDAAIEGVIDRRVTGVAPERVYTKRDKRERDVCTVFLLDLSASTDDPIEKPSPMPASGVMRPPSGAPHWGLARPMQDDVFYVPRFAADTQKPKPRRIIDVEKEALVVMAEALESIGDEYAIYGFSGYGRDNVEFFVVKEVEERYSQEVKHRIDALKPYRSTRMGPPIRHVIHKLNRRPARLKTLIVLSDGYPQDFDYGKDRRGKEYGIQDTKVALQEARRQGIHTFCLTVDREGKSYLPEMCGAGKFIVIEHVAQLPRLLPNIYRSLTT